MSAKRKKDELTALAELFQEVGCYKDSTNYASLLEFARAFPHLAPYNALLVHTQKPGSAYVTSAASWRTKFRRTIRPGARPLVILLPFGPVGFVYELNDTEGEPVPEEIANPFRIRGGIPPFGMHNLRENLFCYGIAYHEGDYGTSLAGHVGWLEEKRKIPHANGELELYFKLVVNGNLGDGEKLATTAHELGHLFCGHIGTAHDKWWKPRMGLLRNEKEFEAESVAWLVCERLGIANPSASYLANYLGENREIPAVDIERIFKAAGMVENMLKGQISLKRENYTPYRKA